MSLPIRARLAISAAYVVAVGTTLALPAAATAAVFHVDDDASAPRNPCTDPDPARACTSISDAVEQARLLSGAPHTIEVAPGRYVEEVQLEEPEDAGLRIEGSGAGADPTTQTIVEHGDDDGFNDGALDVDTLASGVVVRDLRVEVPPVPTSSTTRRSRSTGPTRVRPRPGRRARAERGNGALPGRGQPACPARRHHGRDAVQQCALRRQRRRRGGGPRLPS